jgi:hypothetical protein
LIDGSVSPEGICAHSTWNIKHIWDEEQELVHFVHVEIVAK